MASLSWPIVQKLPAVLYNATPYIIQVRPRPEPALHCLALYCLVMTHNDTVLSFCPGVLAVWSAAQVAGA